MVWPSRVLLSPLLQPPQPRRGPAGSTRPTERVNVLIFEAGSEFTGATTGQATLTVVAGKVVLT